MIIEDTSLFLQRLIETIAWCGARDRNQSVALNLRSPELCLPESSSSFAESLVNFPGRSYEEKRAMVNAVATQRSQHLNRRVTSLSDTSYGLNGGDLLLCVPDMSLSDGAAFMQTEGFFDEANIPPWDTWIGLFLVPGVFSEAWDDSVIHDILLCCVPTELVDLVNNGIWVNPERCIDWARSDPNPLTRELLQLNLWD